MNCNLREMIAQGLFREDLFHRLNVIHLIVPALRDRKEDIRALVEHFLGRMARPGTDTPRQIAPEAMTMLLDYHWPGNVRELQNVIERMVVRARTEVIGVDDVPHEVRANQRPGAPIRERRRTIADELYERITNEQQSFWTTVYPLFMQREITRSAVRDVVRRGLQDARATTRSWRAVQPRVGRLQALPQFPAQAPLPAVVQGVPVTRRRDRVVLAG